MRLAGSRRGALPQEPPQFPPPDDQDRAASAPRPRCTPRRSRLRSGLAGTASRAGIDCDDDTAARRGGGGIGGNGAGAGGGARSSPPPLAMAQRALRGALPRISTPRGDATEESESALDGLEEDEQPFFENKPGEDLCELVV